LSFQNERYSAFIGAINISFSHFQKTIAKENSSTFLIFIRVYHSHIRILRAIMKRPISLLTMCLLFTAAYTQDHFKSELNAIVEELKTPDEFGLSILPKDAKLFDYTIKNKELNILLELSYDFLYQELNDHSLDEIIELQ